VDGRVYISIADTGSLLENVKGKALIDESE
jgi:hypothetical protein